MLVIIVLSSNTFVVIVVITLIITVIILWFAGHLLLDRKEITQAPWRERSAILRTLHGHIKTIIQPCRASSTCLCWCRFWELHPKGQLYHSHLPLVIISSPLRDSLNKCWVIASSAVLPSTPTLVSSSFFSEDTGHLYTISRMPAMW